MTTYHLYKITNDIDDLIYIGSTKQTIHRRFQKHISKCNNKCVFKIYQVMRDYGLEHWDVTHIRDITANDKKGALIEEQIEMEKYPKELLLNEYRAHLTDDERRKYQREWAQNLDGDAREIYLEKHREYGKKRWNDNPEEMREKQREYIKKKIENDPEKYYKKNREYRKKLIEKDPVKFYENKRKSYHKSMEKIKADPIRYEEYKRKCREATRKYRAKKRLKTK